MTEHVIGFALAVVSALCWGTFDIARKRVGEALRAASAVALLMVFQLPMLAPFFIAGEATGPTGGVWSIVTPTLPELTTEYWLWATPSIVINLLANFLFLRSVQLSPLSLTTPYLSFTPVFTAILGMFIYAQYPNIWGWLGIGVVCLGAFFLNPGNLETDRGPLAPLKALWRERGSLYMLMVAVMWSVTPMLDKSASDLTGPLWHTGVLGAGVGAVFLTYTLVRDGGATELLGELRERPWWLAAGSLSAIAALAIQLASYRYTDIAYVETIKRGTGVIMAMVAGYFLFGEDDIKRRLLAALLMVMGVGLVLIAG